MKLLPAICASALVATSVFASPYPVNAAPAFGPMAKIERSSDIIQIRDRWHNGHRGYRYHRRGHRHNGFPAGAFIAGAVIGSVIANSNAYYGNRYYDDGYYGNRYYGERYYGDSYYSNGYILECTSQLRDKAKC